jgi:hypothetical protein
MASCFQRKMFPEFKDIAGEPETEAETDADIRSIKNYI